MIQIAFAAGAQRWPRYEAPLRAALIERGIDAEIAPLDSLDPAAVDYLIVAPGGVSDFAPFTQTKAVLNIWAGVEKILTIPNLTQPLCRMVDPSLTSGMIEWVCAHVLRHHLEIDRHILNPDHLWQPHTPPNACDRPVTILGMGALGQAVGRSLTALGFPVTGWSRSPKEIEGLTCLHGEDGLKQALASAQILVLLLPRTPETINTLNAERLALLPAGAVVINPGRGELIDDEALLAALDTGHIAHATLDVFRIEPLPAEHRYWQHPRVTVTPHIAAETDPRTAASVLAENIRRDEAGEPFLHRVDFERGY